MKITVFKYGEALYPEARLFADRPGEQKIAMSFCFYLIETADKTILVDTGCDGREKYGFYAYKHPVELLAEYGLQPEDITDVILTHCHFDHVEGISFFRDSVIHVQKNEYDLRGAAYIGTPEKLVLFEDEDLVTDGVRVCRYGGHTTDSCVVFAGDYLLCGDEAYYIRNFRDKIRIGNCANPELAQAFVETYCDSPYKTLLFHDSSILPGKVGFLHV